jgi:hypothetical protein
MRQRRLTQDVAGSLRRRRERLVLRVRLYDEGGRVRALDAEGDEARPLVEAADALLEARPPGRQRRS